MGAVLNLKERGKLGDTLILERGLTTTHFQQLLRDANVTNPYRPNNAIEFPNFWNLVTDDNWPLNRTNSPTPWTLENSLNYDTDVKHHMKAAGANVIGGLMSVNTGGWYYGNETAYNLTEEQAYAFHTVNRLLGFTEPQCNAQCVALQERVRAAMDTECPECRMDNVSFVYDWERIRREGMFKNVTGYPTFPVPAPRYNPQTYLDTELASYKTGARVHRIDRGTDLRYHLSSEQDVTLATCEHVIVSAGTIGTAGLLLRSGLGNEEVGKNLINHYGISFVALYIGKVAGNAVIMGPKKLSHTLMLCQYIDILGINGCFVINYGAKYVRRSEASRVFANESFEYRFEEDDDGEIRADYNAAYRSAIRGIVDQNGEPELGWAIINLQDITTPVELGWNTMRLLDNHDHILDTYGHTWYHAMGTTCESVDEQNRVVGEDKLYVGDASVVCDGWLGSTGSAAAMNGYIAADNIN